MITSFSSKLNEEGLHSLAARTIVEEKEVSIREKLLEEQTTRILATELKWQEKVTTHTRINFSSSS